MTTRRALFTCSLLVAGCSSTPTIQPGADASPDATQPNDAGSLDGTAASDGGDASSPPPPLAAMTIRVQRPHVVRGPANDEMDAPLSEIPVDNGAWRAFSANATSYAIDATGPLAIGGARTAVLSPGAAGSFSSCGEWLNEARVLGTSLWGFVHCETACNYQIGQTHKSMSIASSNDGGHTWTLLGQILTNTQAPKTGTITGEGDCTAIDGHDGYVYAYCLRDTDWNTIVARAPVADLSPGKWTKWDGTGWNLPGLGGEGPGLGSVGVASAWWTSRKAVMLTQSDHTTGGVRLYLSGDRTSFTPFPEPLVPVDDDNWARPAPTDLYAYFSFLSASDGSNDIGDDFYLNHVYVPANTGFDNRYYVMREAVLTRANADPVAPRVGIALSRWFSSSDKDRWTTTAPVPGNDARYAFDASLGYLLTAPMTMPATAKLEDCVSTWPGHPDHLLTNDGNCVTGGYTRLRTAGYVFAAQQPNTKPLYRCYDSTLESHFASNQSNCDGLGTMEWQLGYALAQ